MKAGPLAGPGEYKTNLEPEQLRMAQALADIVATKGESVNNETFDNAIHSLAWSVFTTVKDENTRDKFTNPVIQFLIGCCLDRHGSFKRPEQIPPTLSELQHLMRLTYFRQCYIKSRAPGSSSNSIFT
jgi:hypothetical protein